jgi:hypothetical protein
VIAGLANATLQSISRRQAAGRDGFESYADAAQLSVRIVADRPAYRHRVTAGTVGKDVSAVLYVPAGSASPAIAAGDSLTYQLDGAAAQTVIVLDVVTPTKAGGLSHAEVMVRTA